MWGRRFSYRSAGACPPRCLRANERWRAAPSHICSSGSPDPERQDPAILPYREDERDGPAPDDKNAPITVARGPVPRDVSARSWHGEGQALALRCEEGVLVTVARGPVPRDRCMARETRDRGMARDRPSPYGFSVRFWNGPTKLSKIKTTQKTLDKNVKIN